MCGIVIATKVNGKTLDEQDLYNFNKMLLIMQIRGEDSTGIVNSDFESYHSLEPSGRCIGTKKYNKVVKPNSLTAILGHTRLATQGGINKATVHPFCLSNISLIHNGTVAYPEGKGYHSDSHWIACNIDSLKTKEEQFDFINNLQGAYVLAWLDKRDNTFNICRETQRKIYKVAFGTTTYYVSEQSMAKCALERLSTRPYTESDSFLVKVSPQLLKPNTLYSYDIDTMELVSALKKPKTYDIPSQALVVASVKRFSSNLSSPDKGTILFEDKAGKVYRSYMRSKDIFDSIKNSQVELFANASGTVQFFRKISEDTVELDDGTILSTSEFKSKADKGCLYCGEKLNPGDYVYDQDTDNIVCVSCDLFMTNNAYPASAGMLR